MRPLHSALLRCFFLLIGLAVTLLAPRAFAQAPVQDMETSVPANWAAGSGALSISSNHFKLGSQSLRWDWTANDVITVSSPGITTSEVTNTSYNVCNFWLWNGTAMPGQKVRVEFMNGAVAQYWFDVYLDFTGWRRAVRSYSRDMGKIASPSSTFTSVRIIAPGTSSGSFFIDSVRWTGENFTRVRDIPNVDISGSGANLTPYTAWTNTPDIAASVPTTDELNWLNTVRARWKAETIGGGPPNLTSANTNFTALSIVEDANGIRGKALANSDINALDQWPTAFAQDYWWNTATATTSRDKMLQLVRHMLDQGFGGASGSLVPGSTYEFRFMPKGIALMGPVYDALGDAATKAKLWDWMRWQFRIGEFWVPNWARDTDDIYNNTAPILGAILFLTPNDTEAVRMLKGFKRHCEQFITPTDGGDDAFKIDGIGFHHLSHYNGYLGTLPSLTNQLYHLRGTGFQVDATAYGRMRTAYLTMMRMSADGTSTGYGYFGNALSGRNPFSLSTPFNKTDLQKLGEWGGIVSGQTADAVLAQAYNRRYGVNDYALFTPHGVESVDGFHQFNYSPLGIYRRGNWVASMKSTQKYFWSSEIYATENRYGRYQGYGALEILYHGNSANSGLQINGWDWNHPPGTTTIELPDAKLKAEFDREDVRSQLNFTGALALYDGQSARSSGLYASNFQEVAYGVNHNGSFVWRRSWFCFGNQIVCLGSDIANNDAAYPTVTTLFQGKLAAQSTPVTLDGTSIATFPLSNTTSGASSHWMLDTYGTGYYLPPGADIKLSRSTQTSANEGLDASRNPLPSTTGDFAKAWLDHGTAPAGAGYEYVVFPGTNAATMASQFTLHETPGTKPYEVIERDTTAHVVKWKADGSIGYAIFNTNALPTATKSSGMIFSVARPCLVMTKPGASNDAWMTVVDPDLNFASATANRNDVSTPRLFNITLNGVWVLLDTPPAGVSIVGTTATHTTLQVTTQSGLPVDIHLDGTPAPRLFAGTASAPTAENIVPANGAVDPAETVTVNFQLVNNGGLATTNLVASLQSTAGVTPITTSQNYGVIAAAGASATRAFTFKASGIAGGTITPTFQLQDGATNLGTVSFSITLGSLVNSTITLQNFDSVTAPALPAGWTATVTSGTPAAWATSATSPDTAPNCVFATPTSSTSDNRLDSPSFAVVSATAQISFRHRWLNETNYDGGVLEISIGGGAFTDILDAGGSFVTGGYTRTLASGTGNPLDGRDAWNGTQSTYLTTTVNLPAAAAGQSVRLRFRLGCDSSVNPSGATWRIDTITFSDQIYVGAGSAPAFTSTAPGSGTAGTAYTHTFTASGSPPSDFTVTSGALPPGLTLSIGGVLSGTPTMPGIYSGIITADNGLPPAATQAFSITINDAFAQFMVAFGYTGANASPTADIDGDGLSNLMEYAFNTHPGAHTVSPIFYDFNALPDGAHLRLTVPKNPTATNLTYTVEVSSDLINWSTTDIVIEVNTSTQLIVRDAQSISTAPRRFIRLRVTPLP